MRGLSLVLALTLSVLSLTGSTQGAPVLNLLKFDGSENLVEAKGGGAAYTATGSPKTLGSFLDLVVDDHLVFVLRATSVNGNAPSDELTKYVLFRVTGIAQDDFLVRRYTLGSWSVNPFSIQIPLGSGDSVALFIDGSPDFTLGSNNPGDRANSVTTAVDGSLFAKFGFQNGGVSEKAELAVLKYTASIANLYAGLEVTHSGGWDWLLHSLLEPYHFILTEVVLELNQTGAWDFEVRDLEKFRVTPEPGTVTALLAMGGAAGLGLALRRRKES